MDFLCTDVGLWMCCVCGGERVLCAEMDVLDQVCASGCVACGYVGAGQCIWMCCVFGWAEVDVLWVWVGTGGCFVGLGGQRWMFCGCGWAQVDVLWVWVGTGGCFVGVGGHMWMFCGCGWAQVDVLCVCVCVCIFSGIFSSNRHVWQWKEEAMSCQSAKYACTTSNLTSDEIS